MCELPSVLDVATRKARRKHICCECGFTIERGESYDTIAGCWDGVWAHYKQCLGCAQAMTIARDHCSRWELNNGEGPWYSGVWEWWRARETMPPEIAKCADGRRDDERRPCANG